ncbi:MAG: hypothetical protein ACRDZX_06670 [Acidimicrobiales bacterium]
MARRLELAVLEHQSGVVPDDIAVVVLRRLEPRECGFSPGVTQ